jgi:3-deoxy-D-manno-octulosonic acid kinase
VAIPRVGDVVLRRYLRGGLIGKLLVDRYLFPSRPARELSVLSYARSRDVPVPEVLGASVMSAGLFGYRGRIATRMIPDSKTLPLFLMENRDDRRRATEVLRKSGAAVRRMHDAGIAHADLNMNNILVGAGGAPFIIDFDKATVRHRLTLGGRVRNLRRLLRSARKLTESGLTFVDAEFEAILRGYAGGDGESYETLHRCTLSSRSLRLRSRASSFLRRLFSGR